ncbi:ABC transporter substrate-binding protein [Maridesulfovibrio sp.]|uniref:substrate-binding periplasmic protein n=1 Tax=Maridesulfovibrio sp. TaxID=2795000 RepID=UPI002A188095|nr:ABC transporter substrate-binding protein [Maridesulfovibrio sp.]
MFRIIKLLSTVLIVVLLVPSLASAFTLKTYYQDGFPKYYNETVGNCTVVRGLCVEIMELIEKNSQNIKFVAPPELIKFSRIKNALKHGRIDVFLGMTRTPHRETEFIYVDPPLYSIDHVIAVRRDDPIVIRNFEDIRRLGKKGKIMSNLGTSSALFLEKQGGLLVDSGAMTISQNLVKLARGRGRFVFFHNLGLVHTIREDGLEEKVRILPLSFHSYSHYLVFSKHADPEAVKAVGRVLKELARNGKLQAVTAKYFNLEK